jgi:hypothetical protein
MKEAICVVGLVLLGACGSGPSVCNRDGGAACFSLPTEAMGTFVQGGSSPPLQIGCGEIVPATSTMPVTLGGHVVDYDSNQPVAGATIQVFHAGDYDGAAIATATTDAAGAYSMTVPTGTPDLLSAALDGGGIVPELRDQLRPDLGGATVSLDVTTATSDGLDMIDHDEVGIDRDAALAQVWVHVLDCDRSSITHAVVVLSTTAAQRAFVGGVPLFYSVAGDAFDVPTADLSETQDDGTALGIDVPVDGTIYVQAWGFADAAAVARGEAGLTLVAEHAVAPRAGTLTRVELWANQP